MLSGHSSSSLFKLPVGFWFVLGAVVILSGLVILSGCRPKATLTQEAETQTDAPGAPPGARVRWSHGKGRACRMFRSRHVLS